MRINKLYKRILCSVLSGALLMTSSGMYSVTSNVNIIKAFSSGTTIDEDIFLTENEIKDSTLCQILKVIANYTKARIDNPELPELTGNENLLSDDYQAYKNDAFTFGDLKAYRGPINLSVYGDIIYSIEGLGYARGASVIDISGCTNITSIPADEFGKCSMEKLIMSPDITIIGDRAFQQCSHLKEIRISGTAYNAEDNTVSYTDLSNVKKIGNYAFDGCSKLSNVTLYEKTPEVIIGIGAFGNCSSLRSINLPIKNAVNLGEGAFAGCSSLSEIMLMDELDYIPANVFSNTAINTVKLYTQKYDGNNKFPSSLTYIGKNAFQDAHLGNMDFSDTKIEYIGEYGFAGSIISKLSLPSTLIRIDSLAFNSAAIPSLIIPDSVITIKSQAFKQSVIPSITVSSAVSVIEEETFADSSLHTIHFNNSKNNPGKLTSIGNKAFINCTNLTSISLSDTDEPNTPLLTEISDEAFYKCSALSNTDFLTGATKLTTIGSKAFASCCYYDEEKDENGFYDKTIFGEYNYYGLEDITLPDSVNTIGDQAFANNYALVTVNLGSGITSISDGAFMVDNAATSMLQKIIVPKNLSIIGNDAFRNNSRLRTIGYTDGTNITVTPGTAKFYSSLTRIGDNAFNGCGRKQVIKYRHKRNYPINGVKYTFSKENIYDEPTTGCNEYLIYEPGEVNYHKVYLNLNDAIVTTNEKDENTDNKTVYVIACKVWVDPNTTSNETNENTISIEPIVFGDSNYDYDNAISNIEKLSITREQISDKKIDGWNEQYILFNDSIYQTGIEAPSLPIPIYTGLTNVILPNSLTDTETNNALGIGVFENCKALETVALSNKITTLPDRTFYGCGDLVTDLTTNKTVNYVYTGLTKVTGLDRIIKIGDNCFYNCYNYNLEQSIDGGEISNSLKTIGNMAFYNCKSISSVVFHSALISIGAGAFKECGAKSTEEQVKSYFNSNSEEKSYTYYEILNPTDPEANGKGLTTLDFTYATKLSYIGSEAFAYTAVETVNLPEAQFTTINDSLFAGCTRLKNVTIPSKVTSIGDRVFKDCLSLQRLHMPASAKINSTILRGYTPSTISGLVLNNYNTEKITVPLNMQEALPIKALSEYTRSGSYKVTVFEDENDTVGTIIYNDGNNVSGDKYDNILNVKIEYGSKNTSDEIILCGGRTPKKGLIVKIEANSAFPLLNGDAGSIINSQTFLYNVDITTIPASHLDINCNSDSNPIITEIQAQGRETQSIYLKKDQTVTLNADILPSNTTDDCTWTVEHESIATLTNETYSNGKSAVTLTGTKPGNTKITVTCGELTKELYVYVKVPLSNMSASTNSTSDSSAGQSFELPVGGTDKIVITKSYNNTSFSEEEWTNFADKVSFSSNNSEIVSVDEDGKIHANKVGVAEISATALASGRRIIFTITVVEPMDYNTLIGKRIVDIRGNDTMYSNTNLQLTAVLDPIVATNKIDWSVTGSATINDSGLLTAGSVPETITVTAIMLDADNKPTSSRVTKKITVLQASTTIVLTKATSNLTVYQDESITVYKTTNDNTVGYDFVPNTSTDTITCSSSDEKIATCNTSGNSVIIEGISQGTVTITLTASSGTSTNIPITVIKPISDIAIDEYCSLEAGTTKKLIPVITPADSKENLSWQSSNEAVATVDENGTITAIGVGDAIITVSSGKKITTSCKVTVLQKASTIMLTDATKDINMYTGESFTLEKTNRATAKGYQLVPSTSTDKVTCSSSNEAVATVETVGTKFTIKAVGQGSANIILTADSGVTAAIPINVTTLISGITLPKNETVIKGKTITLIPNITPAFSTEKLTWSSSNSKIATVENGVVKGISNGTAQITVITARGKVAICDVSVLIPATGLKHKTNTNQKTIRMVKDEIITIGCLCTPLDTTDNITYTSSKKKIVSVTGSGQSATVKALKKGTAKITAKSSSGVKITFTIKVSKKSIAAKKVKITGKKTVKVNKNLQLTAKLTKSTSTDKISWTSSKPSIASVDNYGNVTGLKKGKCTITATATSGKKAKLKITVKK
ncbi:MAG: hypothetical protein E7265_10570 [Lachnospiraceae bacterium]|nr:hypothetical protein [Lachnospiraceae bacterium]